MFGQEMPQSQQPPEPIQVIPTNNFASPSMPHFSKSIHDHDGRNFPSEKKAYALVKGAKPDHKSPTWEFIYQAYQYGPWKQTTLIGQLIQSLGYTEESAEARLQTMYEKGLITEVI